MTPQRIALADVPPMPWKNGGGVTRELLAWPPGGEWRVRISVAEIESDGPFSSFPGVERWFTVLSGGGVALTVSGREHLRRAGDPPLAFSGEAEASCRLLQGPSRDLNLMLRGLSGTMRPALAGETWSPRASRCGLYALVAGRCSDGTAETEMQADTLAWFDPAPASLAFRCGGDADRPVPGWWLSAGDEKDPA